MNIIHITIRCIFQAIQFNIQRTRWRVTHLLHMNQTDLHRCLTVPKTKIRIRHRSLYQRFDGNLTTRC